MRSVIGVLLAAALLVGCGSGDEGGDDASDGPSAAGASEPTATEALMLVEVCPQVEAALPQGMLPSAAKMNAAIDELEAIRETADVEAQNALDILIGGAEKYARVAGAYGGRLLNGSEAMLAGTQAFADRCQAAGSTAFR